MRKKSILLVSSALLASTLAGCGGQSSSAVTSGGGGLPVIGNAYVVTFNFNDGSSRPMKKEVAKGTSLEKGPTPVREGYDFMGWYTALDRRGLKWRGQPQWQIHRCLRQGLHQRPDLEELRRQQPELRWRLLGGLHRKRGERLQQLHGPLPRGYLRRLQIL